MRGRGGGGGEEYLLAVWLIQQVLDLLSNPAELLFISGLFQLVPQGG